MAGDNNNRLVGILQRAMDAAGIHDGDPETLPDRIQALRFGVGYLGGEYPRCDKVRKEKKTVKGRKKGQAFIGGVV